MRIVEFIMESYNKALEMAARQKERFDEVKLVDDEVDGKTVTKVICRDK